MLLQFSQARKRKQFGYLNGVCVVLCSSVSSTCFLSFSQISNFGTSSIFHDDVDLKRQKGAKREKMMVETHKKLNDTTATKESSTVRAHHKSQQHPNLY